MMSIDMEIVHFQRRPAQSQISIERLFAEIRTHLPDSYRVRIEESPHYSQGLLPRLKNLIQAYRRRGQINHIVGDVHYLAFALPKANTILTIHDCAALNRLTGLKQKILLYLWFSGPMKRAKVVTAISETTKQELQRWTGSLADKVIVIPNCVFSEFTYTPKPFSDPPIVLQVGTGWNKNLERVVQALQGTPCQLEIIGTLSKEQSQLLESSGVPYKALGRISDQELLAAYRRCDLLVFASLYEGFGLPILEAQATGRPVITGQTSAMPEAAGNAALFVDPESVSSIRNGILRIIQEPALRSTLIADGLKNVERFRPEAIAKHYAEVYADLKINAK